MKKKDEAGIERGRIKRYYNKEIPATGYRIKKGLRHLNPLNIPNSLKTTMARAAKSVARIGTGRNEDFKIGFLRLKQAVSAGKITSASQYERALADLHKRHKLEPSKAQVGSKNARDVRNS